MMGKLLKKCKPKMAIIFNQKPIVFETENGQKRKAHDFDSGSIGMETLIPDSIDKRE